MSARLLTRDELNRMSSDDLRAVWNRYWYQSKPEERSPVAYLNVLVCIAELERRDRTGEWNPEMALWGDELRKHFGHRYQRAIRRMLELAGHRCTFSDVPQIGGGSVRFMTVVA